MRIRKLIAVLCYTFIIFIGPALISLECVHKAYKQFFNSLYDLTYKAT